MNIPTESYEMAMQYLVICTAGFVFTAGYNMVSAVLRGMGDSKRPFLFIAIASVVNLALDFLFTGYFGWGVKGAAYATIIGQAVSFVFSIYYLYKRKESFGFDFKLNSFKRVLHVNDTAAIISILRNTDAFRFGVGLSSEDFEAYGIRTIPIRNCQVRIHIGWVEQKKIVHTPCAQDFINLIEKKCSNLMKE